MILPHRFRRLSALLIGMLVIATTSIQAEPTPPATAHPLPADWNSQVVREPVLGTLLHVVNAGDRENPPLVLLHGLGQNGLRDWHNIIESLKDHYYILTLDFPGFGQSQLPLDRLSPEHFAAIVHWLVQSHDLPPVHLAGHSMGGAVALYYAAAYPHTVQRLTLIDAAGILHRAAFVKSMADVDQGSYSFLPDRLERKVAKLMNFGNSLVEKVNLLPDFTLPLHQYDPAWNALLGDSPNANAALSLVHTDYSPVVEAVTTPTTIIWGEQDPVAPLRTGYMLQGLIPNSRLHVIPGAEHVPIKTHTATVAALMRAPYSLPQKRAAMPASETVVECRGRTGEHYSGSFQRLILEGCLNTVLTDVSAVSLELRNSTATALRLRITGNTTGVTLRNSALQLTSGRIQAPVAISLDDSRLDIAGTRLEAGKTALQVGARSVVIASVSQVNSPHYRGKLHGAVRIEDVAGERIIELRSTAKPPITQHAQLDSN